MQAELRDRIEGALSAGDAAAFRDHLTRHDRMSKICLDATILLSDPGFNDTNRNDLLTDMREVVKSVMSTEPR